MKAKDMFRTTIVLTHNNNIIYICKKTLSKSNWPLVIITLDDR